MLILIHMLLMITAVVCFAAGIAAAMFLRKKNFWLKMHKNLNSAGFFLLLAGGVIAFVNILINNRAHLGSLHQQLGLATIILASVTLFFGFYSFKATNKIVVRAAHRWLGRVSFLLILTALILGLILAGII
jgi:Eukaryotic cytochrome b561